MKEMRPRLFRVAKKMWNEWTLDLRDGQLWKSFLENAMRKLGANQKLKSGIFCVLESGICNGRIRNPAPGIRNPQRGIQNLILSWITLHGANKRLQ